MRVLYLLPGAFLAGGVRVVYEHVCRLADRGFAAEVWHPGGTGGGPTLPGWFGRPVPVRGFAGWGPLRDALRATDGVKVATWWGTAPLVAEALRPGETGYYLVQDIETSYAATPAEADRIAATYRLGLVPVCLGRWVEARLRDRFGLNPRQVGIGLDHAVFRLDPPVPRERSVLAQARRWAGGPTDLKNWPVTRGVLAAVAPAGGDIQAVTFSAEAPPDLAGAAHRHVAGPTDAELAGLYRAAGVFLFASRHEGFGLPAAEAMACGCPVVAARANGNEEFCRDGETALMADPGDAAALAAHVRTLLDDPALAARLAAAGRERVQEYRWEAVLDRLGPALDLPAAADRVTVPAAPPADRGVVLLAAELGGGFGHVVPLLRLADGLAADGFRPAFAVSDPAEAWPVLGRSGFPVFQAPQYRPTAADRVAGMVAGYADLLAASGFCRAADLLPRLAAWDALYAAVRPVLVVADHSPAAVLAAAGAVPTLQVGAGFELPPADGPDFPRLLADRARVGTEAEVFGAVQAALAARGRPAPAALPAAFAGPRAVTVLPEFDPYRPVRRDGGVGPLTRLPPPLPPPPPGYFAYLNAATTSDGLLVALAGCGLPGRVYLRGCDPDRADRLAAAGVPLAPLADWQAVLAGAAVVLHHGGVGTAQATLAAGRPQVLLPEHLEHLLTAHLLDERGLGVKLVPPVDPAGVVAAVRQMAGPAAAARCQAFAAALADRPDRDGLPAVLALCRATAANPPSAGASTAPPRTAAAGR